MTFLFLCTGGTIDKNYKNGAGAYNFEIGEPAIARILDKLPFPIAYRVQSILKKDSLDMTQADRELLAQALENCPETHIIITHGTDTMHETAKHLASKANLAEKSLLLVGASKPEVFKDSDADFNIAFAMGALAQAPKGIFITMHGRILPWEDSRKNPETGLFEPIQT